MLLRAYFLSAALALAAVASAALAATGPASASRPNVLILYLDDMGWAQPGCYGGKLAPTPNIDRIAAEGVRFTDGYVSACVCSPSRVGLLTGRYQARSGHDANTEGREVERKALAPGEITFGQRMKAAGYVTGIVGKWHVGMAAPEQWPSARGFDESFGSRGNLDEPTGFFYRGSGRVPAPEGAPITSPIFAREAVAFIERHRTRPWFLYLAFNAVHSPVVASAPVMRRFAHLPPREQAYAALLSEADDAIGTVMARLRELSLEENTLVFCLSDNGGASPLADQGGLRGRKWLLFEGGIRVSWLAQWRGRIPAGRVLATPVIQLDLLPTALAAAGVEVRSDWQLDGVNLLPLLEGRAAGLDRDALYWRFGTQYAVREGEWKLVRPGRDEPVMLFNLARDRGEREDLAARHPERVAALQTRWDRWNATMPPPRWEDPRWHDGTTANAARRAKTRKSATKN